MQIALYRNSRAQGLGMLQDHPQTRPSPRHHRPGSSNVVMLNLALCWWRRRRGRGRLAYLGMGNISGDHVSKRELCPVGTGLAAVTLPLSIIGLNLWRTSCRFLATPRLRHPQK